MTNKKVCQKVSYSELDQSATIWKEQVAPSNVRGINVICVLMLSMQMLLVALADLIECNINFGDEIGYSEKEVKV